MTNLFKLSDEQKEKIKATFNSLLNPPAPAPTPAPAPAPAALQEVPLQDGTVLKYDTPTLSVGSVVTVVTSEGEMPAPAGKHTLQDGTEIEVEVIEGVAKVTEMKPVAPAMPNAPQMQQAIDGLTTQFAEMKSLVDSLKSEKDALKAELESTKQAFNLHASALKELTPIVFAIAEIPAAEPIEKQNNTKKSGLEKFINRKK